MIDKYVLLLKKCIKVTKEWNVFSKKKINNRVLIMMMERKLVGFNGLVTT